MENEVWKDIFGYKGLYQVSNLGRVKSLEKKIIDALGREYVLSKKILTIKKHPKGYCFIILSKNNAKKSFLIHRLVGFCFIPNPECKSQINHLNGNRSDNRLENLNWATNSENNLHAYKYLGRKAPRNTLGKFGKLHHRSKPVIQMDLQGNFIKEYECGLQVERELGYLKCVISGACNKRTKTAYGYKWKFKEDVENPTEK